MFIGHFAVAFASKKVAPKVSLGTLVIAAAFLDVVWPVLVLLGVERFRIVPGFTAINPFDFVYYPWSHSLLMTAVWALLFALVYFAVRGDRAGAVWLGIAPSPATGCSISSATAPTCRSIPAGKCGSAWVCGNP